MPSALSFTPEAVAAVSCDEGICWSATQCREWLQGVVDLSWLLIRLPVRRRYVVSRVSGQVLRHMPENCQEPIVLPITFFGRKREERSSMHSTSSHTTTPA